MARPRRIPDKILDTEPSFLAGQIVSAGVYWGVEGDREVFLTHTGMLPASLDGRVALYIRRPVSLAGQYWIARAFEASFTDDEQDVACYDVELAGRQYAKWRM